MTEDDIYFYEKDNQFVISYELICLLKWLAYNNSSKMKKIIKKALESGLREELLKKNNIIDQSFGETTEGPESALEDIQMSMLDFFAMLEELLIESLDEQAVENALEKNLMPAIDQIDSSVCDDATVRFSIEKATSKREKNKSPQHLKETLLKELLKRWKPRKKNILN